MLVFPCVPSVRSCCLSCTQEESSASLPGSFGTSLLADGQSFSTAHPQLRERLAVALQLINGEILEWAQLATVSAGDRSGPARARAPRTEMVRV